MEIRNAWLQYNELSGHIADLRERLARATDAYQEITVKTSRQEAELEAFNLKRIEVDQVLVERREKEHAADTEMERLESQVALFNKEIEFARARAREALEERERLLLQAETMQGEAGAASEQGASLSEEIERQREALTRTQSEQEQTAQRLAEAEAFVEQLRGMTLESVNTRNRAQTELETVAVTIANLRAQQDAATEQSAALDQRLQETVARLTQAGQEQDARQQQLSDTVARREAVQTERRDINEETAALNNEWQGLREKKSSLEARLASLIELRDSYEGFAVGVRAVMMAKQKQLPGMSGIIGPVGDLLSTEKQYEHAIEAALGGNINNVVVEQAEAAKSAIAFLKEHRAGRVTFLPLDTIRPGRHEDDGGLLGKPGVIGRAIDYVQCDPQLMPAVQYLLYNTLVVTSIDDAIRIARQERRFPRLVTLDGEVVTPAGAVTGGRTQRDSQGLLGRNAEIEELERNVKEAQQRIAEVVGRAQQLGEKAQLLANTLRALEQDEANFRKQLNEVGVILARITAEEENLRSALEENQQRRRSFDAQLAELEARRNEAQSRIGGMADDDETLRRKLETEQANASSLRGALADLNAATGDLRVKLAESLRAFEELKRDQERSGRAHGEMTGRAQKQQQLADEMEQRAAAFEAQIKDAVHQSRELSETRDALHERVLETQREQQYLLESIEQITKNLKESRDKCSASQREVHKLELDCSHREDRIQFYQERIAEEYGLALGSLDEAEVGVDEYDEKERETLIQEHRKALQRLGNVNLAAIEEFDALEKRAVFLKAQNDDLVKARDTLLSVVKRIDATIEAMFLQTFEEVSENFKNYFRRLFNGGQARLFLLDEANPLESGIEIEARPPGKKPQVITLLSGGEQAMTAIALLFSIFSTKPSPFCVLDEVDAPLDDANIGRFLALVEEFTEKSQFIIITHSKQTMARANALFGVTQQEAGISQLVSVRLEEAEKVVA